MTVAISTTIFHTKFRPEKWKYSTTTDGVAYVTPLSTQQRKEITLQRLPAEL